MAAKKDNPIPGFEKATKDFCSGRIDRMIRQMADAEGINEELKARNQLAWVGRMNNIRQQAEEIILNELIYA